MNKHLQTMKNALTNYEKDARAWAQKMEENARLYKPEEAAKANDAILSKMEDSRAAVKQIIQEAMEAGQKDAEAWGRIDPARITDDAKLLDAGLVNPEQFKGLVQKYQDNATMLQLLDTFAKKNSGPAFNWGFDGKKDNRPYFDTTGIVTAKQKAGEYERFAAIACSLADSVGKSPREIGYSQDAVSRSIQVFGDGVTI
jgi:hypothetical protein